MAHPALQGLSGLDIIDLKLLEELAFLAQDHGYSTPGRQYLAHTLGCSIRTVSRHLSKLAGLGYLQRIQRSYRKASGEIVARTNLYRVAAGISERIRNFLGTIGQRFKPRPTGGTPLARIPKAKEYKPIRKQNPSPGGGFPLPSSRILTQIPLLRTWLERGTPVE